MLRACLRLGRPALIGRHALLPWYALNPPRLGAVCPSFAVQPHARHQLELLARHVLRREYPSALAVGDADGASELSDALARMAAEAAERFRTLAADWVRVG